MILEVFSNLNDSMILLIFLTKCTSIFRKESHEAEQGNISDSASLSYCDLFASFPNWKELCSLQWC